ncbi:MAG: dihydrofolate reductase family protein [Minicystis sp.]
MRTLKYHVGSTLDGFIAHPDHTVGGFLFEGDHVTDFLDAHRSSDVVLMGRRTYDFGLRHGVTNPYPTMRQYVFSRTMAASPDPNVTLVSGDPVPFVRALKQEEGKGIWLCGGGELAATLAEAGLVDEVVVKLYPVVFGAGISMFGRRIPQTALQLRHTKVYENGVLLLTYRVDAPR